MVWNCSVRNSKFLGSFNRVVQSTPPQPGTQCYVPVSPAQPPQPNSSPQFASPLRPPRQHQLKQAVVCAFILCVGLVGGTRSGWGQTDRTSSREAENTYAEAASYQNSGQFDLAAEQWEHFLRTYPQDPKYRNALYYAGVCRQQLKQFPAAVVHFTAALGQPGRFSLAEDAYLNLGWSQYSLGRQGDDHQFAKAEQTLGKLIKGFPQSKYIDQALFYLGESRYEQQKLASAVRAFAELVQKHPKSKLYCDAVYNLGVAHQEQAQFADAGAAYDLFLKRCGDSELAPEVRMRKAETLLQTGQPAVAERLFAAVAALPEFADADHALMRQADCAAQQKQFAQAGRLYEQLTSKFPESDYRADATLAAGRSYYRADRFDQAAKWFQECLALQAETAVEAAHWLCQIHLAAGRPAEAAEVAERVLGRGGSSPYLVALKLDQADALYELAASRKQALAAYLKLVREHPQHELAPQALYNSAFGELELGQYGKALKQVAAFLANYEANRLVPDALYVAAESHLRLKHYEEAAQAFARLVDRYPDHAEREKWQLRQGWALFLNKEYRPTADLLGGIRGNLQNPEYLAEALFLIGVSQFRLNEFDLAQQSLAASLTAKSNWRQADETLLYLSRVQQKRNRLAEACATVERLLAEFPQSGLLDQAYYRLGEYRAAAADYGEAGRSYAKLINRWPQSAYAAYALHGMGWSQFKTGSFAAAAESFARLVQDHADHDLAREARLTRAICLRQSEQARQALRELNGYLALGLTPEQESAALYERGLCQAALDDYAGAVATWQDLLRKNDAYDQEAQVLYELAWAYKQLGKGTDAVATFARLAERHQKHTLSAEAHFHVAEDHYDQKRYAAAIRSYQQALQGAGENSELAEILEQAWHKLAWAYYGLGEFETAAKQFARQLEHYPHGTLQADGRFMQAECLFRSKQHRQAWPLFVALGELQLSSPRMQVLALLHGGQCAAQLQRWEDSYQHLDRLIRDFPTSTQLAEAYYERGWAQQNLTRLQAALEDYERAGTLSRGEVGARARFMIGEIQFEQGQHAEAVNSYRRVMYGFGGESAPPTVKQWQAMAGYEAGRCAEVQIKAAKTRLQRNKAIAAAQTFFRFVVEKHGQHQLASKARQRLAALAKLPE